MEQEKKVKSIGLGICLFEASEFTASVIEEIREFIDYVVVGMQKKSYCGNSLDPSDQREIEKLKEQGLVDEICYIDLDSKKEDRLQETDKRNSLLDHIEKHGCTHALIIDSDEYYTKRDFQRALDKIEETGAEVSYCRYVNYYHDFMHYLVYPFPEGNYVPFVTSSKFRFEYNTGDFKKPSDPTRRYALPKHVVNGKVVYDKNYLELDWKTIKMHHLSWIRKDIRKKICNWSAKRCFKNYVELIDKAMKAYDSFDGHTEGFHANLLFNTPNHQVDVEAWPKQYIFPKYDYMTKVEEVHEDKKILVLVMSMNHPQYEEQEQSIRETWKKTAEERFKNIKVMFYKGTDKETYVEGDTIYVKNDDSLVHTYTKTLDAIDFADKHLGFDYDFIFRTNTSSYVNLYLLNEYCKKLNKYEFMLHCAEIDCCWWSKMHFYAKGNALLMNKFYVERVMMLRNNDLEKAYGSTDDCLIGATVNLYIENLGLDHKDFISSFGLLYELDEKLSKEDEEYRDKIVISVKTVLESIDPVNDERKHDVEKMRELHKRLSEKEDSFFCLPKNENEKVMLIEDKQAWLKLTSKECNTRSIANEYLVPYQEALKVISSNYNQ